MSKNKVYRNLMLFVLLMSTITPAAFMLTTPQPEIESPHTAGHFVKTVVYEGEFIARNYWWIFLNERMRAEMWCMADMWYSEALDGWYFVNAYWFFPRFTIDEFGGYHFQVDYILNEKQQSGPYIYEISQTIHGKLYKGSSYRWITMKLTINTGNGDGDGSVTLQLGSGNLNMIWSKRAWSLEEAFQNVNLMRFDPGTHPPS